MNRITITFDERGEFGRICADEPVELYIVDPRMPHGRAYRCSSVEVGPELVAEEIDDWPVNDKDHWPLEH